VQQIGTFSNFAFREETKMMAMRTILGTRLGLGVRAAVTSPAATVAPRIALFRTKVSLHAGPGPFMQRWWVASLSQPTMTQKCHHQCLCKNLVRWQNDTSDRTNSSPLCKLGSSPHRHWSYDRQLLLCVEQKTTSLTVLWCLECTSSPGHSSS
jgi:hypothetical protein